MTGAGVPSPGWGRPKGNPVQTSRGSGESMPELPPQL